jgi:hypothetical protein
MLITRITAARTIKGGTVLDLRLHIQDAMHAALGMAEAAHEAMTRFSGDSEVKRICDLYLGDSDVNRLSAQGKQYWKRVAQASASQPIEHGTNRM